MSASRSEELRYDVDRPWLDIKRPWLDLNRIVICPECCHDPPNLVEKVADGDLVCTTCGLVLEGRLPETQPASYAVSDTNQSAPPTKGMSQKAIAEHKANTEAYHHMEAVCDQMNVGELAKDSARECYKLAQKSGIFSVGRGRSRLKRNEIVAAITFLACLRVSVWRTFRELARHFDTTEKLLGEMVTKLKPMLLPAKPPKYCRWIGYYQNLWPRYPFDVQSAALELFATEVPKIPDLAGRPQRSVAGACIFRAAEMTYQRRSYEDIALVLETDPEGIKMAYKLLMEKPEKEWEPPIVLDEDEDEDE